MNENFTKSRWTPIDDSYPSCERTCANLIIYPACLSHEDITELLEIRPTDSQNLGEEILKTDGSSRVAKSTYWQLSSEQYVLSLDVRKHIDWLLDQIAGFERALWHLQENHEIKMAVNCIWWSKAGHGGPALWPEQMKRLANLNLECTFDIYFLGDDD